MLPRGSRRVCPYHKHTILKSLQCAAVIWLEEFFELRFEVWTEHP